MTCQKRYPSFGYDCILIGRDWSLPLEWKGGETHADAVAVDLTGYTLRASLRYDSPAGILILTLSTAAGGIVIDDATAGQFTLHLTDGQTATLTADAVVVIDIEATAPGGRIESVPAQWWFKATLPTTQAAP